MGPRRVSTFVVSALLLMPLLTWAASAAAEQYRAEEFLSLDLSKAVLSPKRLGPPAEFAPVAVEARSDAPQLREEPSVDYRLDHTTRVKQAHSDDAAQLRAEPREDRADRKVVRTSKVKQARVEKPRVPARTKLARRHGNPLDAQAMDTRIQTWPCKSGGICAWKR
jgi:hypothetical protein